ncbi:Acetyltransferase (GNAT) family [Rubrobacter radiotolerans]|uniref:Acetyltransferase (GNAT) family n=1 Tax=Rubrobacter radiotolerans TaxID=42256 RepID=A0A023X1W5_RUBRA|nr:GNAT family N-acetyltransferase [Rubrobacter radiotolerans]AHY46196.1 Acetyltransferase (GNAT) family [Rubrobacter radiotolerans]MDX5893605.1 GNAT family N-acetyltransferase [Rubrobacter radiotolerans]SMC04106.1 Ribosomal protein S18 acetylase RimI [Rubrobacter radiotolerans DSM 5868]
MPKTLTPGVRRYRAEDASEVRSLHRRAIEEVGAYAEELSDYLDSDMSNIEKNYLQNGGEFLVGTLDGRVVAMGGLRRVSETEAEIKRMRVEPAFQRLGFGKAMLARLEERAVELGVTTLKLDTTVQQVGAQRLYEGAGYRVVGAGETGPFRCFFYRKELR